jgi:hypothetical protein
MRIAAATPPPTTAAPIAHFPTAAPPGASIAPPDLQGDVSCTATTEVFALT